MPATQQFPLACFVGLAVRGVEITVAGYVRLPVTLALCEDSDTTVANLASLQWQHATAAWGTIDGVQLWDTYSDATILPLVFGSGAYGTRPFAQNKGTLILTLPPVAPLQIRQYDIARIPASGMATDYARFPRPFGSGLYGTYGYGNYRAFIPGGFMIPRAYGTNRYGTNTYGMIARGVLLERAFDQQHACSPGTWAPGPFSLAA